MLLFSLLSLLLLPPPALEMLEAKIDRDMLQRLPTLTPRMA